MTINCGPRLLWYPACFYQSASQIPQSNPQGERHEDQDEYQGRQRRLGWLDPGGPLASSGQAVLSTQRSFNVTKYKRKGAKLMKIKTNTKAGSAVWGG